MTAIEMAPPGVWSAVQRHGRQRGAHPAIVTADGEVTYARLAAVVLGTRDRLVDLGVDSTDVVGLAIPDEVQHLVFSLALLGTGAAQVTLAEHDPAPTRARLALAAGVTRRIDSAVADELVVWPSAPVGEPRRDALSAAGVTRGMGGHVYLRTSGTTGTLAVVPLSDAQLGAQATRHAEYAGERLLRMAAIEHNNSKRHRLYCAWAGGTNVFRPPGDFDIARVCADLGVTCLDISRIHAADLVRSGTALPGVTVRTGGAAVPWSVRRAVLDQVTPRLFVRYAATECGGIAMAGPQDHDADETVGRPLPGVEVEIVDDEGSAVASGESGRIRVRAPGQATGYLGDAEATAARFLDGWFMPGDRGHWRADGMLVVEGRADDVIILNGLNISPREVEAVLDAHPDVQASVVLGLPSAVHGSIPVAVVERRTGGTASERELVAHCRAQLGLRAPRRIVVVDRFPLTPQGKISRAQLAGLFSSG